MIGVGSAGILGLPTLVFAVTTFDAFLTNIKTQINRIIPIITAIAALVFLWGVVTYIMSAGDEEKRKEARQFIIWGLVGFAIIVGIWGLINIAVNALGIETGGTITPPSVRF